MVLRYTSWGAIRTLGCLDFTSILPGYAVDASYMRRVCVVSTFILGPMGGIQDKQLKTCQENDVIT